ncbi:unnamed protein product [Paramecium pentaurelia]|uniref:Uncharacterized protein n=1 Tax=Paramecium pentaurelia TaxID=43138 RepID=A0A8S1XNP5_9CILI|nr:unnamed protein product [Paramecium pentaurelia]
MGCSTSLVQNTPIDSISSFSSDDLQESEISLDQIHDEIAYLKINVQKQKEIYPEDNITVMKQWVNCHCNSLGTNKKSDTNSIKSCLKQQNILPPFSQYANPKKVHFVQHQQRNSLSQNGTKKKNKKKRIRRSQQPQQRINLDDIF